MSKMKWVDPDGSVNTLGEIDEPGILFHFFRDTTEIYMLTDSDSYIELSTGSLNKITEGERKEGIVILPINTQIILTRE